MNNVFLKEHGKRALNLFFWLRQKNMNNVFLKEHGKRALNFFFIFCKAKNKKESPGMFRSPPSNARNRNRTGTGFNSRRILSPVRLPVPPPGQMIFIKAF